MLVYIHEVCNCNFCSIVSAFASEGPDFTGRGVRYCWAERRQSLGQVQLQRSKSERIVNAKGKLKCGVVITVLNLSSNDAWLCEMQ